MRRGGASRLAADFTGWKNDDDKFNVQLEKVTPSAPTTAPASARPSRSCDQVKPVGLTTMAQWPDFLYETVTSDPLHVSEHHFKPEILLRNIRI
jgi:hypothetical protein